MPELPDEVTASIVKGFGAYLRDVPANDLPGSLRRYQKFRPQTLPAHADRLLDALAEDGMRAVVVEWLDDKKRPLSARDEKALRLFCARPEGWEEELRALSVPKEEGPRDRGPDLNRALQREKDKARKAREEARKARADAMAGIEAERTGAKELQGELTEMRARVRALEKELRAARAEAESAQRRRERDLRRARREVEALRGERDELKARARDERKRATDVERKFRELDTKPTKRAPVRQRRAPVKPRRRRPLAVPPGRPGDDPETLDEWLETPDVHVLVDGYNVTLAEGGFGSLELQAQRDRLVQELGGLMRRRGARATIVFDGSEVPPGVARRSRSQYARVEYSKPGTIADDHLIGVLSDLPPDPVVVVTNDRDLQRRASAQGATIASSQQLLALIR
jgi:predicted RNA-binding protein with PIN domain